MTSKIEERRFDAGTVELNYAEVANNKLPLMILHGGSAQWDSVEVLIEAFSAEFHIYAPELRGHGKSGWVADSYTLQNYTNDMLAFMQKQIGEPTILFGHSLGGIIALMLAARSPQLVKAVIVGDSPLSAATWLSILKQHADMIVPWRDLAGGRYSFEEIVAQLGNEWVAHNLVCLDPDTHTILIDEPERAAVGYENVLPLVQCPVLLIQADPHSGGLMTNEEVTGALPQLAQPTHVLLEGVSHVLQNEKPKLIIKTMRDFLHTQNLL